MKRFKLPDVSAPSEASALLFIAWVQYFAEQRLGLQQHGGGPAADSSANYNFGDPTKANFTLMRSAEGYWSLKSLQGITEQDIENIVADAKQRHGAGDFGGDVVIRPQCGLRHST